MDDLALNSYDTKLRYTPRLQSISSREIEYLDTAPTKIEVQISLLEYFERTRRLKADRWQRHFCEYLQNAAVSRVDTRVWALFHAQAQLGKPLWVDSLVLMGDGSYKRLGDLKIGDYVISHTGLARKVLKVFEQGKLECLRISTRTGRSVVSALDHPFLTPEGWIEAKDLQIGQTLAHVAEPGTVGVSPRSVEEFELLGYFVGDGCVTNIGGNSINANITSGDPVQRDRIIEVAERLGLGYTSHKKKGARCETLHFKGGVRPWIRGTGIAGTTSWTKRVPEWVFAGSQEQVGAFLGAYFSCDGTVGNTKNARTGETRKDATIEFGSVSLGLLQDVQRLLLRVGVQSMLSPKKGVYKGNRHYSHRLYFCSQDFNAQFAEKVPVYGRKGDRLAEFKRLRKTFKGPYLADSIVSVEPIGKVECRCLSVDVDKTFTADDFVVHNTTILSQAYPAWLLGHDPLHRIALAMYNVRRSQTHSSVVIQLMQGNRHKDIFPNEEGWIYTPGGGEKVSKESWVTNARRELNDGQHSFNPVGLQSGLTGSGFDCLIVDDPYKEAKEAFSETVRENMARMWEYTMEPRASLHSNVFGMFHRYAPEDFAGYLLDRIDYDFDYVRYASEADGDYIHEATGRRFTAPLDRAQGEVISERSGEKYYAKRRQNTRVWLSMFQGRPSSEEGEFFNVGRIAELPAELAAERMQECVALVRSWDQAASVEEHAAYSVGALMGIRANGKVTVFDMVRERLDSAGRHRKQKETATKDGPEVVVTIPLDPGAAGKDVVWFTQQTTLKDFTVIPMPTTGSKEDRALPFSSVVNSSEVDFVIGDWNRDARRELRDFPLSEFKDVVDAMSDGYNHLFATMKKGKIITNYKPQRNLINWREFGRMFPYRNAAGRAVLKIPDSWNIYAGVKTSADASLPNCGIIIARASENTDLEDTIFILGEYKEYDAAPQALFDWLHATLTAFCRRNDPENTTIWMHKDSMSFEAVIRQKLNVGIAEFDGDDKAGYAELNWYFMPTRDAHPVNVTERAARMYGLIMPGMEISATNGKGPDRRGLYSLRREIATCGFDEKGDPAKTCQVLDVLRMCVAGFTTIATELTRLERVKRGLAKKKALVEPTAVISPEQQAEILFHQREVERQIAIEDGEIEEEEYE